VQPRHTSNSTSDIFLEIESEIVEQFRLREILEEACLVTGATGAVILFATVRVHQRTPQVRQSPHKSRCRVRSPPRSERPKASAVREPTPGMRSQPLSPRRVNQRRDAAAMFKKGRLDENLHQVTGKIVQLSGRQFDRQGCATRSLGPVKPRRRQS